MVDEHVVEELEKLRNLLTVNFLDHIVYTLLSVYPLLHLFDL